VTPLAAPAWLVAALLAAVSASAAAAEFRSIAESAAVLYDAPSSRATKLYVIGRSYPVEIIVVVEGWTKIRDAQGELAWIETKSLSDRRTVMVKASRVAIRQAADDKAPIAFQAEQNVLLDLNEVTGTGWVRVTHRDGESGYIRASQVWGI